MSEFRLNDEANSLLASLYSKLGRLTGCTGDPLKSLICEFCNRYSYSGDRYSVKETPKEMFGDLAHCLDLKWDSISEVGALLPMSLQDMINILSWMCEYTQEVDCHCGEVIELSIDEPEETCLTCSCHYSLNLDDFGYVSIDDTDCNVEPCPVCGRTDCAGCEYDSVECPVPGCEWTYSGEEADTELATHIYEKHGDAEGNEYWCAICKQVTDHTTENHEDSDAGDGEGNGSDGDGDLTFCDKCGENVESEEFDDHYYSCDGTYKCNRECTVCGEILENVTYDTYQDHVDNCTDGDDGGDYEGWEPCERCGTLCEPEGLENGFCESCRPCPICNDPDCVDWGSCKEEDEGEDEEGYTCQKCYKVYTEPEALDSNGICFECRYY